MADTPTPVSGAAGRYATALFELAKDEGQLDQTEKDLESLGQALEASDDLDRLIRSPIYDSEDQARGVTAVAEKLGTSTLVRNTVGLLGSKGRLFLLPDVIAIFRDLMADHRGEVTAEVTAARELSDSQAEELRKKLSAAEGRDVKLDITVDESIIGGLVVKVGSRMIDTSIRSRLAGLQNAMREVG